MNYPTAFSIWGDEERAAIERVLRRGQLTMGAEVFEFEREFAAFHGRAHGIMVNSGSSANLVAVAALFQLLYARSQNPLLRFSAHGSHLSAAPGLARSLQIAAFWR